jgi:hypothetical protein
MSPQLDDQVSGSVARSASLLVQYTETYPILIRLRRCVMTILDR